MHEFSICESLLRGITEELDKRPAAGRLRRAHVVIGRLHQIVPDNLAMAFDVLTRDTPLAGAELDLEHKPVRARCRACGAESEIELPFFACGRCGSGDLEMSGGMELYLDRLEVEDGARDEH